MSQIYCNIFITYRYGGASSDSKNGWYFLLEPSLLETIAMDSETNVVGLGTPSIILTTYGSQIQKGSGWIQMLM